MIIILFLLILFPSVSADPNCTLVSRTPADIEANSTGLFEALVNCTDNDGINLSTFLITKTVENAVGSGSPIIGALDRLQVIRAQQVEILLNQY
ncbi:hypothetical protein GF374_00950 [Candidatus Woesearchaeota archaeon]|nr:hypothetical protein [Candidatus Woesearchaeota archaeon]